MPWLHGVIFEDGHGASITWKMAQVRTIINQDHNYFARSIIANPHFLPWLQRYSRARQESAGSVEFRCSSLAGSQGLQALEAWAPVLYFTTPVLSRAQGSPAVGFQKYQTIASAAARKRMSIFMYFFNSKVHCLFFEFLLASLDFLDQSGTIPEFKRGKLGGLPGSNLLEGHQFVQSWTKVIR